MSKSGSAVILLLDEERDFRAAEDDALGAAAFEAADDLPEDLPRGILHCAQAELVVEDAVDGLPFRLVGDEDVDAVIRGQLPLVKVLLHGEPRAEQADAPQPAGL